MRGGSCRETARGLSGEVASKAVALELLMPGQQRSEKDPAVGTGLAGSKMLVNKGKRNGYRDEMRWTEVKKGAVLIQEQGGEAGGRVGRQQNQ